MKLQVPFVQLPIRFDAEALAHEISLIDDQYWRARAVGVAGNSALTLITTGGDPDNDDLAGAMRPTPALARLPYVQQVMATLGATLGRSRLMKLYGRSEVSPHVDTNYYWRERMRVHVPVTTTPDVRFQCGDAEVHMAPGECWIFDTWRRHRVVNDGNHERIHLVVDTVGGDKLWQLIAAGRTPTRSGGPWSPASVAYQPTATPPQLDFENHNTPTVMTPWELRDHLAFLLGDTLPDQRLPAIQQTLLNFARRWQAIWACHGESASGWPAYRALLTEIQGILAAQGVGELGLRNEVGLQYALRSYVFDVALADNDAGQRIAAKDVHGAAPASIPRISTANSTVEFDRPIFIVSPPRSGSTLLFEALIQAPEVFSIGDESHNLFESIAALAPAKRGYDSNRLLATDASAEVISRLRGNFLERLRDREGRPPEGHSRIRMLEKTPKNALRIPFLRSVFPGARFIYLYRDPRQVLGSMFDGWRSGDFQMYPGLPGWQGPHWSFLLTPHWRTLIGKPLEEVVAEQWRETTSILLDDLEALPPECWTASDYSSLIADPQAEIGRLCTWADWRWDRSLGGQLPLSRYTTSPPDRDKWRRHAGWIEPLLPQLAATMTRASNLIHRRQG